MFALGEYTVQDAEHLRKLDLDLFDMTTSVLLLPSKSYNSLEAQEVGKQLNRLLRVLARRGITPIEDREE